MLVMSLLVLIIVPDDLHRLPVMSGGGQTTQVSKHWYLFFTIKLYLFLFIFIVSSHCPVQATANWRKLHTKTRIVTALSAPRQAEIPPATVRKAKE